MFSYPYSPNNIYRKLQKLNLFELLLVVTMAYTIEIPVIGKLIADALFGVARVYVAVKAVL